MRPDGFVEKVRSIAVLRANAVGDFIFTLPALDALRHAYPRARLVLLGQAWHAAFLDGRESVVDEVVPLPAIPGVTLDGDAPASPEAARCLAALRSRGFDIALQMHGGGRHSNGVVASFGARVSAGARAADAPALDRCVAYQPLQNERLRLLEVAGLVGALPAQVDPRLPLTPGDFSELEQRLPRRPDAYVVLQPGARDPRRRWPAERFAQVADRLAAEGLCVVMNGTADEAATTSAVVRAMRAPALDLTGRLGLGALAALLSCARLVVSNDTGPLHLAHAVGTPCVGIYWLTNVLVSAPLVWGPMRAAVSMRVECPVCGRVNMASRCEHDASFVADVGVEEVLAHALELLTSMPATARARPSAPPRASIPPDPTPRRDGAGREAPSA